MGEILSTYVHEKLPIFNLHTIFNVSSTLGVGGLYCNPCCNYKEIEAAFLQGVGWIYEW